MLFTKSILYNIVSTATEDFFEPDFEDISELKDQLRKILCNEDYKLNLDAIKAFIDKSDDNEQLFSKCYEDSEFSESVKGFNLKFQLLENHYNGQDISSYKQQLSVLIHNRSSGPEYIDAKTASHIEHSHAFLRCFLCDSDSKHC